MVFTGDFWRQDRSRSALKADARSMEKSRAGISRRFMRQIENRRAKRTFSLSYLCPTIRDCSWTFVTWPEISFLTDPNFLSFYDIEDIKGNLNDDTHYILGETIFGEKNCFIWDKNFSISLLISTNIFFLFF